MAQTQQSVLIPDYVTVRELAELINASPIEVMKRLIASGIMASINQQIDYDTAAIVAEELGFEAQSASAAASKAEKERRAAESTQTWRRVYTEEKSENLKPRPPIVTILGHVDHGKTTLLDTIRKANVAEGEAGGITQKIGAYRATHNSQVITFIDTPGHEAFTEMRARGAQGADIVVLVVAADDGVMQTTREALTHARAAGVPIIVALTKVDKRNANIERVKEQLSSVGLTPTEWDGDTFVVPVAAVKGEGIDDLLEAITLVAGDTEIIANPTATPSGTVLEARVDPNRGVLATLLLFNGALHVGDDIVAGQASGRIKAMFDENGKQVKTASPSQPVLVLGLHDLPLAGDSFEKVKNDKVGRQLVAERKETANAIKAGNARPAMSLEDIFAAVASGERKELTLVLKVDVQGSLQPIVARLEEISGKNAEGITVRILQAEVGNITESDVMLASASKAIVIGFTVDIDGSARRLAESYGVDIRLYNVIYKLFEDIELALEGMLEPVYADKTIGTAEVRQIFKIAKFGEIAGCYVRDGEIRRSSKVRVKRGTQVLAENLTVANLKRMQDDVREVRQGFECGISLNNFSAYKPGDLLEFYVSERVK
jgi:translation initiation factor IF-2